MKNISSYRTQYAIARKFYYSETAEVPKIQNELKMFDMVPAYYNAYLFDNTYSENVLNCNALKFAKDISSLLSKPWNAEKGRILPNSFYEQIVYCNDVHVFLNDMSKKNMERYYRQTAYIMKAAGMIKCSKGKVFADLLFESDKDIYFALLEAFWNLTEWELIFPLHSDLNMDKNMVKALHYDRSIFRDILLKERTEKVICMQEVADYFSDLTGISDRGDVDFAFFLDFYLLKWLEHFNLVKYHKSSGLMPRSFEVSSITSEILANI